MRSRAAGLPVAPATDDPVVSRIDLTTEYAFATTQYGLRYRALKNLARASLAMRFPARPQLWLARDVYQRRAAYARDAPAAGRPSRRRRALLRTSAKATVQWRQEIGTST